MLFFIYDDNEKLWKEENILLYHDIVAVLDEKEKRLYLWKGPKSDNKKFTEAKSRLDFLLNSPQLNLKFEINEDSLPKRVLDKIDEKMKITEKTEEAEKYKFSKFITVRLYLICLIAISFLGVLLFLNLFSMVYLNWNNINIRITSQFYTDWLTRYRLLLIFQLVLLIFCFPIGLYEREYQVMTFSLMGIITSIGLFLLLNQGIFLFLFLPGSTSSVYFISIFDIFLFLIINSIALSVIILPHLYKLITFIKTYRGFIF
ncbi:MAG: hypothetical protein EU548_02405 [Promethearchaeota archaeon]|nr:MAG: hypothetical protein EU548_02405 [Candidatus Lokiarchaeota archaeon]